MFLVQRRKCYRNSHHQHCLHEPTGRFCLVPLQSVHPDISLTLSCAEESALEIPPCAQCVFVQCIVADEPSDEFMMSATFFKVVDNFSVMLLDGWTPVGEFTAVGYVLILKGYNGWTAEA